MHIARLLLPASFLAASVWANVHETPADVIRLLQTLEEKNIAEQRDEAVTYTKIETWCKNQVGALKTAIGSNTEKKEVLQIQIESYEKNLEVLVSEIARADAEIERLSQAGVAADGARSAGVNLYQKEKTALEDTIDAIERAIAELGNAKTNIGASLLSSRRKVHAVLALIGTGLSEDKRNVLEDFAAPDRPTLKALGDYDSHKKRYSFKSSNVTELLKELQSKFEDDLLATNKAETNAANAGILAGKARTDLASAATTLRVAKDTERTDTLREKNEAGTSLADVEGDLSVDSDSLKTTSQSCHVKRSQWAARSETREGEREAINAAIGILSKVTGVRTEAPTNPVLPPSPVDAEGNVVFLQLDGGPNVEKAVHLLWQQAHLAHSKVVEQIAQELSSHRKGPFGQVTNMIEKLIFRLMHEQTEEDEHKAWCDQEIAKTDASVLDKTDKITDVSANIASASSKQITLADDIVATTETVAALAEALSAAAELQKLRQSENAIAIQDAETALHALQQAMSLLQTFYKSSGQIPKESWEFVQRAREPVQLPEMPAHWESSYTGVADPTAQPDGILNVLENIAVRFTTMKSDTQVQAATDKAEYDDYVKACKIQKARHAQTLEGKIQEKKRLAERQVSLEGLKKATTEQKDAGDKYLHDLQGACVDGDSTYAQRAAARATEVTGLKDAKELLETAFTNTSETEVVTTPGLFLQRHRQ